MKQCVDFNLREFLAPDLTLDLVRNDCEWIRAINIGRMIHV